MQMPDFGIYIHIPFCSSICHYCDFVKTNHFNKKLLEAYSQKLLEQFYDLLPFYKHFKTATVYLGGGTPSLMPSFFIEPLLKAIQKEFLCLEITLECNPSTLTERSIASWSALGVCRWTLGVQSLCPEILSFLGRKHQKKHVETSLSLLQKASQKYIQCDLIYGIKKERSLLVTEELSWLVDHGASGLSLYALSLEKGTFFEGKDYACEEKAVEEYISLIQRALELGMNHYEISNLSFFEDGLHNHIYWKGLPYMACGIGAHGLLPLSAEEEYGRRYVIGEPFSSLHLENLHDLFQIHRESKRTFQDAFEEDIMTLLRLKEGVALEYFLNKFPGELGETLWEKIRETLSKKYPDFMIFKNNHITLTLQGMLFHNKIVSEFLYIIEISAPKS